jgi:hypothetical protein
VKWGQKNQATRLSLPHQDHIQPHRHLIVVKSRPPRILPALLKAKECSPGITYNVSPLHLNSFSLFSYPKIHTSVSIYIPFPVPWFGGEHTNTVTWLVNPLKLTANFSPFCIGPPGFEGSRVMDRIKSLSISGQCSKSKNCCWVWVSQRGLGTNSASRLTTLRTSFGDASISICVLIIWKSHFYEEVNGSWFFLH